MIRLRYVLGSLLAVFALITDTKAVDKEKLRRAASPPVFALIIGYGVSTSGQFASLAPPIPEPAKIVEIEGELKGDATDAERYSRLADLYYRANQLDKGKEARLKAVEQFRKQFEQHPDEIAIRLRLADALSTIERLDEAEALVRRVVQDHPHEWRAWLILGRILDGKSWQVILGGKPFDCGSPAALLQSMKAMQPTEEKIAASQQCYQDAVACFDRAISIAREESEAYRWRGVSRYYHNFLECGLRLYRGEKADFLEWGLGRGALPDLRKAVELDRQEFKGIGMVASAESITEIYERLLQDSSVQKTRKMIELVSAATRKRILEDMKHLEQATRAPARGKAAEAAEVLGYLQWFLFGDISVAEEYARRSTELDPDREVAWEILCNCLVEAEDWQKLAVVCRERLGHKDSARNRLELAKAYSNLDQRDKAEKVVRTGLQREPDDFMLRLTLADLLLMRGDDESLHQARELLVKLREENLSDDGKENRCSNYVFACGIYYGMIGDKEEAQKWLKAVEKSWPEYPGIKDALKALEE